VHERDGAEASPATSNKSRSHFHEFTNPEPLVRQNPMPPWIGSDQSYVPFDRLDHLVHLSAPHLFGKAKSEAFGRVERYMRG
jgi:hypothetical protein